MSIKIKTNKVAKFRAKKKVENQQLMLEMDKEIKICHRKILVTKI
jgi:hypothetical protein